MQIGAINSVNFKGMNESFEQRPYSENPDYVAGLDFIDKAVSKANQNVHPSTIIATACSVLLAAYGGLKFMPYLRKASVKVVELASKLVVKAGSLLANGIKKITPQKIKNKLPKIDLAGKFDKLNANIDKLSDKLRNGAPLEENGFSKGMNKILNHLKDVFGEENMAKIEGGMKKFNMKNGVGTADALTATAIAYSTMDGISDSVENVSDKRDIKKALNTVSQFAEVFEA